jgi:AhpD family alkylhydroperoxidase
MSSRIDWAHVAPRAIHAVLGVEQYVRQSSLEPELLALVKLRASYLNGCAYCVDMHTKDARLDGASEQRLYAVPVWRETPFFTPRERAALAFTEAVTELGRRGVPDEVFDASRAHFSDAELVDLAMAVVASHDDCVLELRRETSIRGDDGPSVRQQLHLRSAEVHHGLDGDGHPCLQLHALSARADVHDERPTVHHLADAVTAVFAHHAAAFCSRELFDGCADVPEPDAMPHNRHSSIPAAAGDLDDVARLCGDLADAERRRGVPVKAIQERGHVHVHDVARMQPLVSARDAVTDDVVPARADRRGEAVEAELARLASPTCCVLAHPDVDVRGGDSRGESLGHVRQCRRSGLSGVPHPFDFSFTQKRDSHAGKLPAGGRGDPMLSRYRFAAAGSGNPPTDTMSG